MDKQSLSDLEHDEHVSDTQTGYMLDMSCLQRSFTTACKFLCSQTESTF